MAVFQLNDITERAKCKENIIKEIRPFSILLRAY